VLVESSQAVIQRINYSRDAQRENEKTATATTAAATPITTTRQLAAHLTLQA